MRCPTQFRISAGQIGTDARAAQRPNVGVTSKCDTGATRRPMPMRAWSSISPTPMPCSQRPAPSRRLDLDREVPDDVLECLQLAVQPRPLEPPGLALDGGQGRRRRQVSPSSAVELVATTWRQRHRTPAGAQGGRVMVGQLSRQNLEKVPVMVIPLIVGRLDDPLCCPCRRGHHQRRSGPMGSIVPAMWSFRLALRAEVLAVATTSTSD